MFEQQLKYLNSQTELSKAIKTQSEVLKNFSRNMQLANDQMQAIRQANQLFANYVNASSYNSLAMYESIIKLSKASSAIYNRIYSNTSIANISNGLYTLSNQIDTILPSLNTIKQIQNSFASELGNSLKISNTIIELSRLQPNLLEISKYLTPLEESIKRLQIANIEPLKSNNMNFYSTYTSQLDTLKRIIESNRIASSIPLSDSNLVKYEQVENEIVSYTDFLNMLKDVKENTNVSELFSEPKEIIERSRQSTKPTHNRVVTILTLLNLLLGLFNNTFSFFDNVSDFVIPNIIVESAEDLLQIEIDELDRLDDLGL